MAEVVEDTMNKRETIMEDGKRKLYYFTFGDESVAQSGDEAEADDKEADNE